MKKCRASSFERPSRRRYRLPLLSPGTLMSHEAYRLVLLRSRPDTVHGVPLHKTQTSMHPQTGSSPDFCPPVDITPAVADCRYRAPLSPRLHDPGIILNFSTIVNCQCSLSKRQLFLASLVVYNDMGRGRPDQCFPKGGHHEKTLAISLLIIILTLGLTACEV